MYVRSVACVVLLFGDARPPPTFSGVLLTVSPLNLRATSYFKTNCATVLYRFGKRLDVFFFIYAEEYIIY